VVLGRFDALRALLKKHDTEIVGPPLPKTFVK